MRIELRIHSTAFRSPRELAEWIRSCLGLMVLVDRALLRAGAVPTLYRSGVRYRTEPEGTESFADAATALEVGHGDCAHLAAWRCAELQEGGEGASLRVKWTLDRARRRLYHIQVRRGDGRIEDPSRVLGMGVST